jgi:hypothetical protein
MQIGANTTGMLAGLTMFTDKDGRDWCVVVVKGTFTVAPDGSTRLAEKQAPLVYADEHYGDPAKTSIKYECDFAAFKPRADVLVVGHAVAPKGKKAEQMMVGLEVGPIKKEALVLGDRVWETRMLVARPTPPEPFEKVPLVWERAFGGTDETGDPPKLHGLERQNPVGVGFFENLDAKNIVGKPLPNVDDPKDRFGGLLDRPKPIGFGVVGRSWLPRIKHAGTYDKKWLDEKFPFLPSDFDYQYFQSAPVDQQCPHFQGGEQVRCTGMVPEGPFWFQVPKVDAPLRYRFREREEVARPVLDTLIIEPDQRRFSVLYRHKVALGRKIRDLKDVLVGPQPKPERSANGKQHYDSLEELIASKKKPMAGRA